jgi:hypothetical protein
MLFLQLALVAQTYYWPIYFQSVRNTSAEVSGIYMLPLVISNSLVTVATGYSISKIGYYVPFMWAGAALLSVGSGLFQLLSTDSPASKWIGYQIISGLGYGMCIQIPIMAVQVVLDSEFVPTGVVMVIFFQCLGGALATSIGQNLFTDRLIRELRAVDGVDVAAVVKAGAKDFRKLVPVELMNAVAEAFGSATRSVFLLALATAVIAFASSWVMEWRSLPRDRKEEVEDSTSQEPQTPRHKE